MKSNCLVMALVLAAGVEACQVATSEPAPSDIETLVPPVSSTRAAKPDFDSDIKPIFKTRCMPCHFQGGKVYDKLPFDKAETIAKLGTKLFTRIKDEKEQSLIREYLAAR